LYLFNFIGKTLGKAVYEQVVLDIELAPFFLRHFISRKNLNYSCFDDLMFLDRDLYNNLNFLKVNFRTFSILFFDLNRLAL